MYLGVISTAYIHLFFQLTLHQVMWRLRKLDNLQNYTRMNNRARLYSIMAGDEIVHSNGTVYTAGVEEENFRQFQKQRKTKSRKRKEKREKRKTRRKSEYRRERLNLENSDEPKVI